MIIYFDNDEVEEIFDVKLSNDTLTIGTYAGWRLYQDHAHVLIVGDLNMEFDVDRIGSTMLENGGEEIEYGIVW